MSLVYLLNSHKFPKGLPNSEAINLIDPLASFKITWAFTGDPATWAVADGSATFESHHGALPRTLDRAGQAIRGAQDLGVLETFGVPRMPLRGEEKRRSKSLERWIIDHYSGSTRVDMLGIYRAWFQCWLPLIWKDTSQSIAGILLVSSSFSGHQLERDI